MAIEGVGGGSAAGGAGSSSPIGAAANNQLDKNTFLKLLVAQIRNQNPLNPADGVQFVSQLAQFSELEQVMSIRSDLEQMHSEMKPATAGPAPQGEAKKSGV